MITSYISTIYTLWLSSDDTSDTEEKSHVDNMLEFSGNVDTQK